MRTAALGCCLTTFIISGWLVPGGAIAQTPSTWEEWGATGEENEILPYPVAEADGSTEAELDEDIPLYPDPMPTRDASPEAASEWIPIPSEPVQAYPAWPESGAIANSDDPVPSSADADSAEPNSAEPLRSEPNVDTPIADEPILLYPDEPTVDVPLPQAPAPLYPLPDSFAQPPESTPGSFTVQDVQIVGADADLQAVVQDVISTRPGESATPEQLQTDRHAIEGTGLFASVNVSTSTPPGEMGTMVVYEVEPLVVRSLQLSGSQVLPPDLFDDAFQAQVNRPISPQLLNQGADTLDTWYRDNGYTLSKVVAWITDPSGVVTVEVMEPVIGSINLEFLEEGRTVDEDGEPIEGRTREEFILRELDSQPGDVFNQNAVVGDLETLLRLGIFQDANVALDVNEASAPPEVDVTYQLEEGFARTVRVGGGISTELGLFGSLNYQDRNFRGIGEEVRLGVQAGGRGLEFNTGYTSPYRDSNPERLGYSVNAFRSSHQSLTFSDEVPLENGDDARERRLGGGVSVMRPMGEWDAELGLDYARVSIRDEDGDIATRDELGNRLTASDSGIDDLLTVGLTLTQDRRINPLNPAGGSVLRLSTDQSIPVGNGSILMNRLRASYAQYMPVDLFGSGSLRNPEVFAFNLQGGVILGELPPYEAFDLGGTNSVRGYRGGEVGSGRSYVLASAEYRFPLFSTVGGVLFTDLASDLGSGNSVEGDPGGSRDKPGTGLGYGFGIRIGSPIGLIRADFGFNDQGDSRFHFGFGQRF